MISKDIRNFINKEVKIVKKDGDIIIGKLFSVDGYDDENINITINILFDIDLTIQVSDIESLGPANQDQTEKGNYIFDRLEKLDIDIELIIKAMSIKNYSKIYELLINNLDITKDEFLKIVNFDD